MEGVVFGLLASLGFGSTAILVRLGVQSVRPTTGAWVSLLTGTLVVLILALVFARHDFADLVPVAFFWIGVMGFLNFAMGRLLNIFSIQKVGATRASPLFSLAPLSAMAFAIIFLGEVPNALMLVGTFLVVVGVGFITSDQVTS